MPEQSAAENQGKIKTIINALRSSREVEKEFRDHVLSHYLIGGKLTEQWAKEMAVSIPDDATTGQCRLLLAEISSKIETVSKIIRDAEVVEQTLSAAYDQEFDKAFESRYEQARRDLHAGHIARMPAEKSLNGAAAGAAAETKQAHQHAKIAVQYFKRLMEKLLHQSEQVSRILIALGIEAKIR